MRIHPSSSLGHRPGRHLRVLGSTPTITRVSDLSAFASDLRRVAAGQVVIDQELVSRLVSRRRERDPLSRTHRPRAAGTRAHGPGPDQRRTGPRTVCEPEDGRGMHPQRVHETWSATRRARAAAGAGSAAVPPAAVGVSGQDNHDQVTDTWPRANRVVAIVSSLPPVRALRRAVVALVTAGAVAGVLKLRGTGGVPPQKGGWRELSGPDLR